MDLLLDRAVSHLTSAFARVVGQADPTEPLGLARLSCAVGTDGHLAPVFSAVLEELDAYEAEIAPPPPGQRFPVALRRIVHALIVARTPDVPLPDLPGAPPPTRAEAES